jgi:uracil-DNA glycosylase
MAQGRTVRSRPADGGGSVKPRSIDASALGMPALLEAVRACTLCAEHLAHGPRPVLRASATARILVVGQAPGRRVHASGVPFDDPSGDRLRQWMDIGPEVFYDESVVALVPMGFCYPGTGKSGDLAPRRECAPQWRGPLMAAMPHIELTLVVGQYAKDWHLPAQAGKNLTQTVQAWRELEPGVLPLPHPSPRNNIWLSANPWFEAEVVPELQRRVRSVLRRP